MIQIGYKSSAAGAKINGKNKRKVTKDSTSPMQATGTKTNQEKLKLKMCPKLLKESNKNVIDGSDIV